MIICKNKLTVKSNNCINLNKVEKLINSRSYLHNVTKENRFVITYYVILTVVNKTYYHFLNCKKNFKRILILKSIFSIA